MDIQKYISSGILELYVYGALSEKESHEVSRVLKKYPEIKTEVEEIEKSLLTLSAAAAPNNAEHLIASIKNKLTNSTSTTKAPSVTPVRSINWITYSGWAASLLLLVGLFIFFNRTNELREDLQAANARNVQMEEQIANARENAENAEELLAVIRDRNVKRIPLQGQQVAPEAFASVYWNTQENTAYIDAKDLPEPPRGKVYQVWSLTMQPLTPTSIGLLADFETDDNKVFSLENQNQSEAFGITLEPEGGSETPTMEQLYVLGTVAAP
ncbi:Anti-sigma-K factor rskA [Salegentibacter holothuriorum]|uniref:Anti-sigma-K factor rskA n=1 Tax=Salegentibacter holothuriorum TaxID=241145 RepID=A0A1T5EIC1_9FLAO|nr:anti-sigma factor [Salegentibacter holothuriorum]SKB83783.1 Anti-sigma-K factor rskA [Salegentibacter holothuriorum]